MRATLLSLVLIALAAASHAEPRVYELSVPAVQCSYSSEKARLAVERAVPVSFVTADARTHKVTVRFEDEQTSLDAITAALAARGYPVVRQQELR